ncbi:MAG: hypothetical protein ACI9VR_000928 [Cognaticolwellia sp.]|jgi:hypothetical protein
MWMVFLACASECDPGFEARDSHCYWIEGSGVSPQILLQDVLQFPLPDPATVVGRYQSWIQRGDSSCPGVVEGVWDNPGCTTDEGVEFAGKALLFWGSESEPSPGEPAVGLALQIAASVRDGERSVQMGGIVSYDATRQDQGYTVHAAVTGDFFETPEQKSWMAKGLGHSLYISLDTQVGAMDLDGGVSNESGDLYFDQVQVVDGCPQGQVLVHEHLAQGWTELNWNCGCGTVAHGPLEGQEFCAPLAERAAELDAALQELLP